MGGLLILCLYAIVIAIIATVAYFVIKKAVKDALVEWEEEKRNNG